MLEGGEVTPRTRTELVALWNRARVAIFAQAMRIQKIRARSDQGPGWGLLPSYPNLPKLHLLPIVNSVQIWRLGIARIATLAQCAFKIFALGGVSYILPNQSGLFDQFVILSKRDDLI